MDERAGLLSGDGFLGESKKWKVGLALASLIAIIGIGVSIGLGVQLGGYKSTANPNFDVRKVLPIFLERTPRKKQKILRAYFPPARAACILSASEYYFSSSNV
jgi:hypothetical protein